MARRPPRRPPPDSAPDTDETVQDRYRSASGQFRTRDFRKPQLSAEVGAPLNDEQRRRGSGARASATRASGIRKPDLSGPRAIQNEEVVSSDPNHEVPPRPATPRPSTAANAALADAPTVATPAKPTFLRPDGALPWPALATAALLLLFGTLLLPLHDGGPMLWQGLSGTPAAPWALGAQIALGLVGGCGLLFILAYGQGALSRGDSNLPDAALLGCGLLATAYLVFRSAAAPGVVEHSMAPLRSALGGIPDTLWWGVAAGGLLSISERQDQRHARGTAVFAVLALILNYWTPIGFVGESRLPLMAALASLGNVAPATGELLTYPWMASPLVAIVSALLPVGLLVALAVRVSPNVLKALGVSCLVWAAGSAVLVSSATNLPTIGGTALANGATALLIAACMGITFKQLSRKWDDEALMTIEWVWVVAVMAVWLLAKLNGMRYSATDEGIYFYAAKAWADGLWPYYDFFFSHPPLHIALPAIAFAFTGFSFLTAKAMSALAIAIAAIFVWRIGRRTLDPVSGVLAMGLFLFAAEVMKSSTNLTGINLTTMWAVIGLWAALKQRGFLAGAMFGAAAATGFYAVGYFLAITVLALFAPNIGYDKRAPILDRVMSQSAVQLLLGFALVFGATNLIFYLLAGETYIDGVYRYHFLKRAKLAGFTPLDQGLHAIPSNLMLMLGGRDFRVSLYYHGAHYVLGFLAPAVVAMTIVVRRNAKRLQPQSVVIPTGLPSHLADRSSWAMMWDPRLWWIHRNSGGGILLLTALSWALLTEFAQFKERFDFYYTLLLPPISLLAAAWLHGLVRLGRVVAGCGSSWNRPKEGPESKGLHRLAPRWAPALLAGCIGLTLLWVPVNMWANRTAFPSEVTARRGSKGAGEILNFSWTDTPGPSAASELTRALLWKGHRVRGNLEAGMHHYLWSKKRWFSTAEDIAKYIREHSHHDETVTGSSTHAPMVALLAGRRMAGDHVDTNSKTFKTGVVSRQDFWTKACKDRVKFIVAGPRSYFSPRSMPRRPTVTKHFRLVREFQDSHLKHWRPVTLQLWERRRNTESHICTYEGPQPPLKRRRGRRRGRRKR